MPSLVVTIDSVRVVLRKARKSTPFRGPVEYCMIEWLREEEVQWVVEFLQSVSARVPLRALVHGDIYALPAKVPHGPIVNARPLLNFTTMWKLVGAHIASQYVPLVARAGPCTQFALHASSSIVDLLRVLHDYVWFRFLRRKRVCLVMDDFRHAYGSVVHDTLRCLLRLASFPEVVIDLLLLATTEATFHMGESGGVAEALAPLLASVAQGCPARAMVFCVVAEVRAFQALLRVPLRWGPGGPFNRLGYMDDTTWCIDSESDLPLFADNLQRAGLKTNLFSSGPKQLLVIALCEAFQVNFHPLSVHMGGSRMPVHQGPGYVRIVGRHLFPHVYHKVDKAKLFIASRRASRALAMVWLTSNYPCQMCSAVAGGQQRWQAGVRPPTYDSMRVADQAAASVLRAVTGWHALPSA